MRFVQIVRSKWTIRRVSALGVEVAVGVCSHPRGVAGQPQGLQVRLMVVDESGHGDLQVVEAGLLQTVVGRVQRLHVRARRPAMEVWLVPYFDDWRPSGAHGDRQRAYVVESGVIVAARL